VVNVIVSDAWEILEVAAAANIRPQVKNLQA